MTLANHGEEYAVVVDRLSHHYPAASRPALDNVSLTVRRGEIFSLLGPNGSGKSTLFRILATSIRPSSGMVTILGNDIERDRREVRQKIGVVFQHPALDGKLTAAENLLHQGHLYGMSGRPLHERIVLLFNLLGLQDRARDFVEHLSGGLQRRVELAKSLLHEPALLILDEPSTGLDPGARREFMNLLKMLRERNRLTVVLTTHLLDEAEKCDRVGVIDQGRLIVVGSPRELTSEIGGDVITIVSPRAEELSIKIREQFGGEVQVVDGTVRLERRHGHAFIPQLVEAFPGFVDSVTVSRPTLEDVFIHHTGHRFWVDETPVS